MEEDIRVIAFLLLPALYLSGFFFTVRQVVNSTQGAAVKAVLILGLACFLLLLSLITLLPLAWSTNPWTH